MSGLQVWLSKQGEGIINTSLKWFASLASAALLLAGCGRDLDDVLGGDPNSTDTVTGYEREWTIVADHQSIKAGDVTFTFTNKGTVQHELLVIRTDLPLGAIPIGPDNKFNEDDPNALNLGETGEYDVGTTSTFKVTLDPGKYQLVCNLPGHYANGMHIAFVVD